MNQAVIRNDLLRRLSEAVASDDLFGWLEDVGQNIADVGFDGFSVRLDSKLLGSVGAARVVFESRVKAEARVERTKTGFDIVLDDRINDVDKRVLLAHEIAHVYLSTNSAISRIIGTQKLNVDPDIEKIVDWLAYSILVPRVLIEGEHPRALFEQGFSLARRWRVPSKVAFFRIMTAMAEPADLAIHLSSDYEDVDQLSFFEMKKSWKASWSLLARRSSADKPNGGLFIEKQNFRGKFIARSPQQPFLDYAGTQSRQLIEWMMEIKPLRRFLGARSSVPAIAAVTERSEGAGPARSSYVLLCR